MRAANVGRFYIVVMCRSLAFSYLSENAEVFNLARSSHRRVESYRRHRRAATWINRPMFDISRSFRIATLAAAGLILAAPVTAGVLPHYSFDNAATTDDSGNGQDLTAGNGGPTQVGGQFGSAADFNGSSFLYLNGAASNSAFNFGAGDFPGAVVRVGRNEL